MAKYNSNLKIILIIVSIGSTKCEKNSTSLLILSFLNYTKILYDKDLYLITHNYLRKS